MERFVCMFFSVQCLQFYINGGLTLTCNLNVLQLIRETLIKQTLLNIKLKKAERTKKHAHPFLT